MGERQWYYVKDGEQEGPIPEAQLVELFRQGILGRASPVWTEGLDDWTQASQIDGLIPFVAGPSAAGLEQPTPERPTSVTVFGILNIVFGGLGALCMPFGMCVSFVMPDLFNPTAGAKAWLLFSYIIGFAATIVLLVVGIGLLGLRSWARRWAVGYGWFAIVWGIVGTVVNMVLMRSGALGYSEDAMSGAMGAVVGEVVGLVYYILLIIFMQRPHVKAACIR
ncbi:MAG: DUF4339 domain-containing protein [Planctomycetota bacterium]|jgi:hypothetical protein